MLDAVLGHPGQSGADGIRSSGTLMLHHEIAVEQGLGQYPAHFSLEKRIYHDRDVVDLRRGHGPDNPFEKAHPIDLLEDLGKGLASLTATAAISGSHDQSADFQEPPPYTMYFLRKL